MTRYLLTVSYLGSRYHGVTGGKLAVAGAIGGSNTAQRVGPLDGGWTFEQRHRRIVGEPGDEPVDKDEEIDHGTYSQSLPTVTSTLSKALRTIFDTRFSLQFSSRTDAGVHAFGNTCHVDAVRKHRRSGKILPPLSPETMVKAMNTTLMEANESIRLVAAQCVPHSFHSRHQAVGRTYLYRIIAGLQSEEFQTHRGDKPNEDNDMKEGKIRTRTGRRVNLNTSFGLPTNNITAATNGLLFDEERAWMIPRLVNVKAMREAAQFLQVGEGQYAFGSPEDNSDGAKPQDMAAFRGKYEQTGLTMRRLDRLEINTVPAGFSTPPDCCARTENLMQPLEIVVRSPSFMHAQVRNMVGALVSVGLGNLTPEEFKKRVRSGDRTAMPPPAPPNGLYLLRVHYDDIPQYDHMTDYKQLSDLLNCPAADHDEQKS
eukprot:Clim_evm18s145 gene=Clim_evmTU18s145